MKSFSVSFDPIAFCTAVFAVWFAFRESRRGNSVILKIRDCRASYVQDAHDSRHYEFRILIENRGRSLHDVSLGLSFTGKDGSGRLNFPIPMHCGDERFAGEFSKGMIAEFLLHTDRLDTGDLHLLSVLEDVTKQDASIAIFSQRYLAKRFHLCGVVERLKCKWAALAYRVNSWFERKVGVGHKGVPIVKTPSILPKPVLIRPGVEFFLRSCTKLLSDRIPSDGSGDDAQDSDSET
jgi:hypothetical protein